MHPEEFPQSHTNTVEQRPEEQAKMWRAVAAREAEVAAKLNAAIIHLEAGDISEEDLFELRRSIVPDPAP